MRIILLVCVLLLIAGCATFKATVDDIKADPVSFKAEVDQVTGALEIVAPPFVPKAALVGLGALIVFGGRWIKKTIKKPTADPVV